MRQYKSKPSWDLAPKWATHILKNISNNLYVFSDMKIGTPCMGSGDTFRLIPNWWDVVERRPVYEQPIKPQPTPLENKKVENSGGSCDYYKVRVTKPTTSKTVYTAECNDVIESLNMTYAEANMFKEIWRTAAARTLGKVKAGHDARRGAEKIIFFAERHGVSHGIIR